MHIELLKPIRMPAHLAGKIGDKLEVKVSEGQSLIKSGHAKEITKKKGKNQDGQS